VLTGHPVSLKCNAIGPGVVYQWIKNGVILSKDNTNIVMIPYAKESDEGTYQCVAVNNAGNDTSFQATITVYGKLRYQ